MAEFDFVEAGISGLDVILASSIPRGNVTLLEGGIVTGTTMASCHQNLISRAPVRRVDCGAG
jgi:hypothetical protein